MKRPGHFSFLLLCVAAVLNMTHFAHAQRGPASQPALDPNLRTIFIASDSTAASGTRGWGSHLPTYIDRTKINIVNGARGGQSSRTFQSAGSWKAIIDRVKKDDIVLIQFGHNDITDVKINDPIRQRGVIQTLGEETVENNGQTVHTFGWYMRKMINETRAKEATPIIISMTTRRIWTNGKVERGANDMTKLAIQLAKDEKLQYVDLTNMVADAFEAMGEEKVAPFFPTDHTHTSVEGADFNAKYIVSGLKALKGKPFEQYLTEKGKEVQPDTKYAEK